MGTAPQPRFRLEQLFLAVFGISLVATGLVMLLSPYWFFQHIGRYPPFNSHYAGDAGAFILGWGLALLLAARDPVRYRSLIAIGGVANLLHALNHIWDALQGRAPMHWSLDVLPLAVAPVLFAIVYIRASLLARQQEGYR